MVVVNFRLEGFLAKKVERYIRTGCAASKAEVIRIALTQLTDPLIYEDISDDPEMVKYLLALKTGKIKSKIVGTDSNLKKLLK